MNAESILIVDDEQLIRWSLREVLAKQGFQVAEAATTAEAYRLIAKGEPDLLILDQNLPDGTGIDVLHQLNANKTPLPVIMLTAIDRSDIAVQAMKLGAFDYVTKPVNHEELVIAIRKALEATRLKRQVAHFLREQEKDFGFCGMIGSSPAMKGVFDAITKIAESNDTTVLITGESGTGKELAAKALHFLSARREKPLMTINCSAIAETLVETELFGHEKGAFTDARTQKQGLFELADGGTVFLDEIGDIPPKLQVKLLRVLEQKTFQRVGGTRDITVDVRIIAATNRLLEQRVSDKLFRADLFYRLHVATVRMPLLSERGEDILILADFFLQEFNAKFQKSFTGLAPEARQIFLSYPWPGNVREMRNVIERAVLLFDDQLLRPDHVTFLTRERGAQERPPGAAAGSEETTSLADLERQALCQALEKAGNNQSLAARMLSISRDTLRYRMKKYRIPPL